MYLRIVIVVIRPYQLSFAKDPATRLPYLPIDADSGYENELLSSECELRSYMFKFYSCFNIREGLLSPSAMRSTLRRAEESLKQVWPELCVPYQFQERWIYS